MRSTLRVTHVHAMLSPARTHAISRSPQSSTLSGTAAVCLHGNSNVRANARSTGALGFLHTGQQISRPAR